MLCSNTLSMGDPPVCATPAFAPLVTLVQYLIVFNFILGAGLVTRRIRECGVQQAFAQYRFGFTVWVAATVMLVVVCVASVVAIVDIVRTFFALVRAFLNSNN